MSELARPRGVEALIGRPWLLSLLLLTPIFIAYAAHFLWTPAGHVATGFTNPDIYYHLINVRSAWTDEGFVGLYGNAFSPDYDSPRIYFQPHILFIGTILRWTGLAPGLVFDLFGILAAWVGVRLAVRLYDLTVGLRSTASLLGLVCFLWGGGVVLISTAAMVLSGREQSAAYNLFDSFDGYWMHFVGRNFIYSTEAYYHALAFGLVCALLMRRFVWAGGLLALLSMSHPFTGIQYCGVTLAFVALDFLFERRRDTLALGACALAVTAGHAAYYLLYLPSHAEHALLMQQWTLDWSVSATSFFACYVPVLALAAVRLVRQGAYRALAGSRGVRLLVAWALVSVVLIEHDLLLQPRQPIHFTHGHLWAPLFLLGAPLLNAAFAWTLDRPTRQMAAVCTLSLLGLVCLDEIAWFAEKARRPHGVYFDRNLVAVGDWLNEHAPPDALIASNEGWQLAYPLLLMTNLRAWWSHPYNTPNVQQRSAEAYHFIATGERPAWATGQATAVVLRGNLCDSASFDFSDPTYAARFGNHCVRLIPADGTATGVARAADRPAIRNRDRRTEVPSTSRGTDRVHR